MSNVKRETLRNYINFAGVEHDLVVTQILLVYHVTPIEVPILK